MMTPDGGSQAGTIVVLGQRVGLNCPTGGAGGFRVGSVSELSQPGRALAAGRGRPAAVQPERREFRRTSQPEANLNPSYDLSKF